MEQAETVVLPATATQKKQDTSKKRKRLLAPREEIAWYPTIKPELCNGCGDCKVFCKPGVFELGEPDPTGICRPKLIVAHPYNCIVLCNRCVPICTSGGITLPPKEEFERYIEYID
jgi:NAD-dependent dihydropyrimidine dehydrogenase PreA subunit